MPRFDLGPTLEALKAEAAAEIDRQAEAARLRFLTGGSGQALEYQATEAEARAFLASGAPFDPALYPFVEAERLAAAQLLGAAPPADAVAQEIVAQSDAWKVAGSAIKTLRRAAKLLIEAAGSVSEVRAALAVEWPAPPAS